MSRRSPLRGFRAPQPPQELRGHVLDGVRRGLDRPGTESSPAESLIDRLWENRAARWALAGAVILVLLGHLAIGGVSPGGSNVLASPDREWRAAFTVVRVARDWRQLNELTNGEIGAPSAVAEESVEDDS